MLYWGRQESCAEAVESCVSYRDKPSWYAPALVRRIVRRYMEAWPRVPNGDAEAWSATHREWSRAQDAYDAMAEIHGFHIDWLALESLGQFDMESPRQEPAGSHPWWKRIWRVWPVDEAAPRRTTMIAKSALILPGSRSGSA